MSALPATEAATCPATWDDALRALAHDVERAEAMLEGGPEAEPPSDMWTPPIGLGPLPARLADSTRVLLDRQLRVAERLALAARHSRQHDRALSQLSREGPRPPVFIDTPA